MYLSKIWLKAEIVYNIDFESKTISINSNKSVIKIDGHKNVENVRKCTYPPIRYVKNNIFQWI